MTDTVNSRARLVGLNHVAIEVDDPEVAREWYESIFSFELRGRTDSAVFLDMGDQFLAIVGVDDGTDQDDEHRHLGLVVDDAAVVEDRLDELNVQTLDTDGIEFQDPWGNRIQVVEYEAVQFTKAPAVLRGMGLSNLEKTDEAISELEEKGLGSE